jgi:predicted Ser/Thr protein kinase
LGKGAEADDTMASMSGAGESTPDALIGKVIAERYMVEGLLGEGGMGSVYLARHLSLDKEVALKVLHAELSRKSDLVERFLQEAKSASKIRNQHVIDITDFGVTDQGQVFFAMELLRGRDLHDLLVEHQGLLPWTRAREILLQVCSALSSAHDLGIVHRDLKPENIFLIDFDGKSDFVKLLDFGIAKLVAGASEDGRRLTRTGVVFGTPEYMSPEQAKGEEPDHRVDVYAMGCLAYQLLAGRVPFQADSFMGVLTLHMTEEVQPIPSERLASVGAPDGINKVLLRALDKDKSSRYPSVEAFAEGLRSGEVLPARQPASATFPADLPDDPGWAGSLSRLSRLDEPEELVPSHGRSAMPWVVGLIAAAAVAAAVVAVRNLGGGAEDQAASFDAAILEVAATADAALIENLDAGLPGRNATSHEKGPTAAPASRRTGSRVQHPHRDKPAQDAPLPEHESPEPAAAPPPPATEPAAEPAADEPAAEDAEAPAEPGESAESPTPQEPAAAGEPTQPAVEPATPPEENQDSEGAAPKVEPAPPADDGQPNDGAAPAAEPALSE